MDVIFIPLTFITSLICPVIGICISIYSPALRQVIGEPTVHFRQDLSDSVGALIPIMMLLGISIHIAYDCLYKKFKFSYHIHLFDSICMYFCCIIILSIIWSPYKSEATIYAIRCIVIGISHYFIIRIWLSHSNNIVLELKRFLLITWTFGMLISTYGLLHYFTNNYYAEMQRLYIGDISLITSGLLVSISIYISFVLFVLYKQYLMISLLLLSISIVILFPTLLLTGTKSSFIGLIFALPLSVYNPSTKKLSWKLAIYTNFYLLIFLLVFVSIVLKIDNPLFTRLYDSIFIVDESITSRTYLLNKSLLMFSDSPIIGAGACWWREKGSYPHNIFLEILSSFGIIGLSSFLLLTIIALNALRQPIFQSIPFLLYPLGIIIISFLVSQFSRDLPTHRELYVALGFLIQAAYFGGKPQIT